MTTERFTQTEFEAALPAVPFTTQRVKGELVYYIPVYFTRPDGNLPTNKRIVVRSSIDYTGLAADSGQDSIRHWVEYHFENGLPGGLWKPLSKGGKAWTTRVPGWGARLTEALRELWQIALDDSAKFMKKGANNGNTTPTERDCVSERNDGLHQAVAHSQGRRENRKDDSLWRVPNGESDGINDGNRGSRIRENDPLPSGTGRNLSALSGDSGSVPEPTAADNVRGVCGELLRDRSNDSLTATDNSSILSFLGEPSTVQLPDDGRDLDSDDAGAVEPDDAEPVAKTGQRPADVCAAAVTPLIKLNSHQQAVVDALAKGPQVIEAAPGSGKTRTLENLVAALILSGADPSRIGVFTFSNQAASEARYRIARTLWPDLSEDKLKFFADPFENKETVSETWIDADPARRMIVDWICTIHAMSLRLLKKMGEKVNVLSGRQQWDANAIIKDALAEMRWNEAAESVKSYISMAILNLITPAQAQQFYSERLAGTDVAWRSRDLAEIYRRYVDFCRVRKLVDFDMMQARVLKNLRYDPQWRKAAQGLFDYIIVDEAQDTDSLQAEILWTLAAKTGNILFCGDVDQCVLEGELILTPSGYKPVEQVRKFDKVISALGGSQSGYRFVTEVSKQQGTRVVVTIEIKSGHKIRLTNNHIVFAVAPGMSQRTKHLAEDLHFVYLMYKRGYGYRIGKSSLPMIRMRGEHADRMWLIYSTQDESDAYWHENYFSAKYGLPTMTFEFHGGGTAAITQDGIDRLFKALDTETPAQNLARDMGMILTHPHLVAGSNSVVERTTIYYTICDYPPQSKKSGRRKPGHLICGESSTNKFDILFDTVPLTTGRKEGMRFRLAGLDAKEMESKAKHFAELTDSELVIRGRFGTTENYSLMPQAMPAGNVLPGFLVPVHDGTNIVLDEIVKVDKSVESVTVYDLEVMETANFIAGGIVVHNSMYAFRGAHPDVLRDDFKTKWPNVRRFDLPVNYRSTKSIIARATQLIGFNYEGPEDPYLKAFDAREDAPDGADLSYIETESFAGLCEEVAALVIDNPPDWYVLSRTRAECAAIHTELVRQGIPAMNKSGGMLFGSLHVRKALAYAMLACDYDEARNNREILEEIANVASIDFRAPFTKRNHLPGCTNAKGWVDCGCPTVMVEGQDHVTARYYGTEAIRAAGNWNGIVNQQWETNRGGFPTPRAKGARDLVGFVERIEKLREDARACLNLIISDCIQPWLEAEYGDGGDLAENGKVEDLNLLLSLAKPDQTMEQYLREIDRLSKGSSGKGDDESVILGTAHWAKGSENKKVICNITRLPIVAPKQKPGRLPVGRPATIEEERRLLYVMITRAKEECYVVASQEWNGQLMQRSRFVEELGLLADEAEYGEEGEDDEQRAF